MDQWYKSGKELLAEIENTKNVPEDAIAVWFLGQESLVVKSKGKVIYLDPFFSEYLDMKGVSKRSFPPPFSPEEIKHADIVLCTHNHIDHMDPETLSPMAQSSKNACFVVPKPHTHVLEKLGIDSSRIISARENEEIHVDHISILPVAAAHEEYQVDENGDHLFLGYVIRMEGITLYHAGDTVETEELGEALSGMNIDIACLPINGRDLKRNRRNILGNMNAREAADLAASCNADLVIPMHYDLFAHNGENPAYFADYMIRQYPGRKFHIMTLGERLIYIK